LYRSAKLHGFINKQVLAKELKCILFRKNIFKTSAKHRPAARERTINREENGTGWVKC